MYTKTVWSFMQLCNIFYESPTPEDSNSLLFVRLYSLPSRNEQCNERTLWLYCIVDYSNRMLNCTQCFLWQNRKNSSLSVIGVKVVVWQDDFRLFTDSFVYLFFTCIECASVRRSVRRGGWHMQTRCQERPCFDSLEILSWAVSVVVGSASVKPCRNL